MPSPIDPSQDEASRAARRTLAGIAAGMTAITALTFVAAVLVGSVAVFLVGLLGTAAALIDLILLRRLRLVGEALQAAVSTATEAKLDAQEPLSKDKSDTKEGKKSLRASPAKRRKRFTLIWEPFFCGVTLAIVTVIGWLVFRGKLVAFRGFPSYASAGIILLVVCAIGSDLLARFARPQPSEKQATALLAAAGFARTVNILQVAAIVALLARLHGWPALEGILGWACCLLLACLLGEFLVKLLLLYIRPPSEPISPESVCPSVLPGLFADGRRALASFATTLQETIGFDPRDLRVYGVVRQLVGPVLLVVLLLLWAMTTIVIIQSDAQGLVERFGRLLSTAPLQPGLHFKLPWPIDAVRIVPTRRIRSLDIGFENLTTGRYFVWSKQHAAREYYLLLGQGRELLSVNATLLYRVSDLSAYTYTTENPEKALKIIAYRALLAETITRDLRDVLSRNRQEFAQTLLRRIRKEVTSTHLGIDVVALNIRGAHPPVAVAPAYQDVVSAQIDQLTRELEAEVYKTRGLEKAKADATTRISSAKASSAQRLAEADGQAARYKAIHKAFLESPRAFRLRKKFSALEKGLKSSHLVIVDDRISEPPQYWLYVVGRGR